MELMIFLFKLIVPNEPGPTCGRTSNDTWPPYLLPLSHFGEALPELYLHPGRPWLLEQLLRAI